MRVFLEISQHNENIFIELVHIFILNEILKLGNFRSKAWFHYLTSFCGVLGI